MGAAPVPDRATAAATSSSTDVTYRQYKDEADLPLVMGLIDRELSEPYSIFTYRYFLNQWPHLCYLALVGDTACGVVVCKMDQHRQRLRGYLAMLVVDHAYRGKGIGITLAQRAIGAMASGGCEEVVLEAEVTNSGALGLYRRLGFVRDKRLHKYYLSGKDAYRLKLLLPKASEMIQQRLQEAAEAMAAQQAEAAAAAGGGGAAAAAAAADGYLSNEASDDMLSSAAESMVLLSKSQLLAEQGQGQGRDMDPRMSISSDDFVIVK